MSAQDDGSVGRFLCDAFDAWLEHDDPDVFVRILSSITSLLIGGRSHMIGFGGEFPAAVSIATDGTLGPDDTLRSCGPEFFYTKLNVANCTLRQLLDASQFKEVFEAGHVHPSDCSTCCWEGLCGGGQLVNRFSAQSGFARKSVYCNSLKMIYAHIANYLIEAGEIDTDALIARFCGDNFDGSGRSNSSSAALMKVEKRDVVERGTADGIELSA